MPPGDAFDRHGARGNCDQSSRRHPAVGENDVTYAVCKSDLLIKGDAHNIKPGSCISADGHARATLDYMLTNPPYGLEERVDLCR